MSYNINKIRTVIAGIKFLYLKNSFLIKLKGLLLFNNHDLMVLHIIIIFRFQNTLFLCKNKIRFHSFDATFVATALFENEDAPIEMGKHFLMIDLCRQSRLSLTICTMPLEHQISKFCKFLGTFFFLLFAALIFNVVSIEA